MTKDNVTELPQAEPQATVIPFGKTQERHPDPEAKEKISAPYREPQIHLLRRVLGDTVLDIFPTEFIDAVEAGKTFWDNHPNSYLDTLFDSESEKDDTLAVMRAYSEIAGPKGEGYTIATRSHDDPAMLVWRAQPRRKHNRKD